MEKVIDLDGEIVVFLELIIENVVKLCFEVFELVVEKLGFLKRGQEVIKINVLFFVWCFRCVGFIILKGVKEIIVKGMNVIEVSEKLESVEIIVFVDL